MTKKCTRCQQEKDLDKKSFRVRKMKKNGELQYRSECRECERKFNNNWKQNNSERVKNSSKEYREKTRNSLLHQAMRLIKDSKQRAKKKNLEHTLTKEELYIPKYCPVLGHELKPNKGTTASACSPTIDRMNNNRGYTKDNIKVISFEANTIKGSATSDKLFKVALYAQECEGKGNFFTRWLKKIIIKWL